jgi:hypothetical protein
MQKARLSTLHLSNLHPLNLHHSRALQVAMLLTCIVAAIPMFCVLARVYFNLMDWARTGTLWYVSPTLGVAPLQDVIYRIELICDALMALIALTVLRLFWVAALALRKR